ncbi:MAG: DUF1559 domain-containing protein [Gemmataceae bacterium]
MSQSRWVRWGGLGLLGLVTAGLVALPLTGQPEALAQPAKPEPSDGLRFVPADAAFFLHADIAQTWDSNILKDVRKADPKSFEFFTGELKKELGLTPSNVKSVVVFVPKLKGPDDTASFGVVVTFNDLFNKTQFEKGAEKLLPMLVQQRGAKVKVLSPDDRTAVILSNLKEDEYGKPRAAKAGPLSNAFKAAASGKHAVVVGATLASLPGELLGDDAPPPIRAFQPLFRANTIHATLDLDKNPTLNVHVKTGTAGQAVDCEKSLAALLALVQDELEGGLKQVEKDPGLKDLVTLMRAVGVASRGAKFTTFGSETQLTLSLPGDLPFATAFIAAKNKAQEAAAAATSANNLKQIAIALHNYESTYAAFPPAAVCDKTGKPLLSWRVLILPYIEEATLFKQFKLDEPWDSENNKKLLAKMPKVFAIPGKTQPGDTTTHYRVFVGGGAGWDWVMGSKLTNITDGTSNTLMCVTAAEAVPWTKPDELVFDPEKDPTKLLGAIVNGRVQVAMFDGSVRTLKKVPAKDTLKALITKGGGEVIDDFE